MHILTGQQLIEMSKCAYSNYDSDELDYSNALHQNYNHSRSSNSFFRSCLSLLGV